MEQHGAYRERGSKSSDRDRVIHSGFYAWHFRGPERFPHGGFEQSDSGFGNRKENNDIINAQTAFRTAVVAQRTELSNLQWEKSTYAESLDMYTTLEADMAKYYKQGYVTQSEYKSSQVNKENYRIKCIINRIDFLIYNNSTKALFVRDDEFISDEKNGEAQDEKK